MKTQYTRFEKSILQSISNLINTKSPISFDALELYYKLAHQTKQNAAERTKKQANYYHSK